MKFQGQQKQLYEYLKNRQYFALFSKKFSKFFDRWIAELPRKVKNLNWNNSAAHVKNRGAFSLILLISQALFHYKMDLKVFL